VKTKPRDTTRILLAVVAAFALVSVAACGEYAVPITDQPTRKVDRQLIGDWVTPDGIDMIKIRQLTDSTYIVSYNGVFFRAFHSDFAKIPFLSVQELETDSRIYSYVTYRLSPDGSKIYLRMVNEEVISDESNESGVIQKLLLKNLQHPALFHSEEEFRRQPGMGS
jgi:hypothetical protein